MESLGWRLGPVWGAVPYNNVGSLSFTKLPYHLPVVSANSSVVEAVFPVRLCFNNAKHSVSPSTQSENSIEYTPVKIAPTGSALAYSIPLKFRDDNIKG